MAVCRTTPWRWISGILGVMCLVLTTALVILFKMNFFNQSIQPKISPGLITDIQEDSDCCPCQENWLGYLCNCYFISRESKTLEESRNFCVSQNSSLLQLHGGDELACI
ncbi:natural killer cells antigen CD94-like [Erinaceus europaeus]|uniref:Natural killer cells antigen CD94-like n=1 Tax=Erinaceus europaeus TaxID=9365 RepID=A0ABM3XKZ2_ERIEU|nr:natural killer cells antigen CD94-like [Erinaceus europaeus]